MSKTYQITPDESEALSKGLNFCYGIRIMDDAITDTVATFETALDIHDKSHQNQQLTEKQRHYLRCEMQKYVNTQMNRSKEVDKKSKKYLNSIKRLRENKDIFILKADKGNSTVILDRSEYETKIEELLSSGPYKK